MSISRKAAAGLLSIGAVRLAPQEPFTWASGRKSPIYTDNRLALSDPDLRDELINGLTEIIKELPPFNAVAGVATAGIPHGTLLADRLKLPFAYVRAKAKAHGRQNLIEGRLPSNSQVLVVEDLISTGGSSLAAVNALRDEGYEVIGVAALFTYGFKEAQKSFDLANCPLVTLTNYPILLEVARQQGKLTEEQLEELDAWREDAAAWSAERGGKA